MTETLRIRMYNVGFGDCFLLTIPTPDGPRRMLIDCGTHPASTGPHRAETDVVDLLLDDLRQEAGRLRLDVVAVSHRHKDHVSGFAREQFHDVEVGEVWLPWTENPNDRDATRLRDRMGLAADGLRRANDALTGDRPALAAAGKLILNNLALRNEKAMEMLWSGFAGHPDHWYVSAAPEPHTTPVLPGVSIHVLGPSKDEATIRDLDPPSAETFGHLVADTTDPGTLVRPFAEGWSIPAAEFEGNPDFGALCVPDKARDRIRKLAEDDLLAAAASLESSINGTSLVFVLEIGGLLLFFPGDAQWGTWKAVLDDQRARDLVGRSSFYKIGHHGSHNASPVDFVNDVMAPASVAAISVAGVAVWPAIPQPDLVTTIQGRNVRLVRSDRPPADGAMPGITVRDDRSVDFSFALPAPPAAAGQAPVRRAKPARSPAGA